MKASAFCAIPATVVGTSPVELATPALCDPLLSVVEIGGFQKLLPELSPANRRNRYHLAEPKSWEPSRDTQPQKHPAQIFRRK